MNSEKHISNNNGIHVENKENSTFINLILDTLDDTSQLKENSISSTSGKIHTNNDKENNDNTYKRKSTHNMLPQIFSKGIQGQNYNLPYVYSLNTFHPLSFMTGTKKYGFNQKTKSLLFPAPTFINDDEWKIKPDLSKNNILSGMVIHLEKGLVLVDKLIMVRFEGIITDMIKQMIKAALGGGPVSLKVKLFEPKSTLQRISEYWSFAPQFLSTAAKEILPLERMKQVITFAIAGLYIPTKQLKPFNPLIGETFQGEFENKTKIYCEHIGHYPTLARFLIKDPSYCLNGFFDFSTSTESFGRKINVYQKGPIKIDFLELKEQIIYNMPAVKLLNAASTEDRSGLWVDSMVFVDIKNNLKAVVKFGGNKKDITAFEGYIFENNFDKNYKYDYLKEISFGNSHKIDYTGKNLKSKIVTTIKGSWLREVVFNDKEMTWSIDKFVPNWIRPLTQVLPSDCRFREDLIWLYRSFNSKSDDEKDLFLSYAQGWKVIIEQIQRAEREIRKKNKPKK